MVLVSAPGAALSGTCTPVPTASLSGAKSAGYSGHGASASHLWLSCFSGSAQVARGLPLAGIASCAQDAVDLRRHMLLPPEFHAALLVTQASELTRWFWFRMSNTDKQFPVLDIAIKIQMKWLAETYLHDKVKRMNIWTRQPAVLMPSVADSPRTLRPPLARSFRQKLERPQSSRPLSGPINHKKAPLCEASTLHFVVERWYRLLTWDDRFQTVRHKASVWHCPVVSVTVVVDTCSHKITPPTRDLIGRGTGKVGRATFWSTQRKRCWLFIGGGCRLGGTIAGDCERCYTTYRLSARCRGPLQADAVASPKQPPVCTSGVDGRQFLVADLGSLEWRGVVPTAPTHNWSRHGQHHWLSGRPVTTRRADQSRGGLPSDEASYFWHWGPSVAGEWSGGGLVTLPTDTPPPWPGALPIETASIVEAPYAPDPVHPVRQVLGWCWIPREWGRPSTRPRYWLLFRLSGKPPLRWLPSWPSRPAVSTTGAADSTDRPGDDLQDLGEAGRLCRAWLHKHPGRPPPRVPSVHPLRRRLDRRWASAQSCPPRGASQCVLSAVRPPLRHGSPSTRSAGKEPKERVLAGCRRHCVQRRGDSGTSPSRPQAVDPSPCDARR